MRIFKQPPHARQAMPSHLQIKSCNLLNIYMTIKHYIATIPKGVRDGGNLGHCKEHSC